MRLALVAAVVLLVASWPLALALPLPHDDAGTGRDAPDGPRAEIFVRPGDLYAGRTTCCGPIAVHVPPVDDDADTYAFWATAGSVIEAVVASPNGACAELMTPAGAGLHSGCTPSPVGMHIAARTTATGEQLLRVVALAGPSDYRFSVGVDAVRATATDALAKENDGHSGYDAPGAAATFVQAPAEAVSGTFSPRFLGDQDAYTFSAQAGERIRVDWRAPVFRVSLYAPGATTPLQTTCGTCAPVGGSLERIATTSGTWTVQVTPVDGGFVGPYSFNLRVG